LVARGRRRRRGRGRARARAVEQLDSPALWVRRSRAEASPYGTPAWRRCLVRVRVRVRVRDQGQGQGRNRGRGRSTGRAGARSQVISSHL